MPIFDVTDYVINNGSRALQAWLNDNVGEYYGPGIDGILRIGSGWEILTSEEETDDGAVYITFIVDITDESKSTAFALRWM